MTGVEALAVGVLARVHIDRPPDPENEIAASVGSADGDEKLGNEWALNRQPVDDSRFRIALAIFLCTLVVTITDAMSVRYPRAPQSWTAPASWSCPDDWTCRVAYREDAR